MASPVFLDELTVIDDFEDSNLDDRLWEIGGTTGRVTVSTSIVKQGTQTGAYQPGFASAWVTGIAIETTAPQDLTNTFLWTWCAISDKIFGNLDTIANGGLRLRIYTGTLAKDTDNDALDDANCNYAEFYVGGIDTLHTGWMRHVFYVPGMTPISTNGTVDFSNVTAIGFILKFASDLVGVNSPEFWIDIFHKGTGVQIAGGTEDDPIDMAGVMAYTEDKSRAMGIVEQYEGIYFLNGMFKLGSSTDTMYMYEDRQLFVFSGHYYYDGSEMASAVGDGFNGFVNQHADNVLKWLNHSIRVANVDLVSWNLDFEAVEGSFVALQSVLYGAKDIKLNTKCYLRANFNFCDNVKANGANMDNCAFVVNAYFWISSLNTPKNISMMYSYYGVLAGDDILHLSNYSFEECTFEVTHYDGGTLEIYQEDGTQIDPTKIYESGGGNTVLYNKRTKSFTGLPDNTEVRVVQGSTTLAHEANITGGVYDYTYDVDNDEVTVRFTCPGYKIDPINFLQDEVASTIPATVKVDPSYI